MAGGPTCRRGCGGGGGERRRAAAPVVVVVWADPEGGAALRAGLVVPAVEVEPEVPAWRQPAVAAGQAIQRQLRGLTAAAAPAAEDEDAEEDAAEDLGKDATANEDLAAAKEEEEEDAEEDAEDQAAAKAEKKQDKVDEESEDKDEGESRIVVCCVFWCFLSSRLAPKCAPLSSVCIVVHTYLTFCFSPSTIAT